MTMMIHTAVPAPIRPPVRIKLEFFRRLAKLFVRGHRHNREAQDLLSAHDAILKDVGLTRLKSNGNTYLFLHRD